MTIYLVVYFDGSDTHVIVACESRETADAIAARLGDSGSVEEVHLICGR